MQGARCTTPGCGSSPPAPSTTAWAWSASASASSTARCPPSAPAPSTATSPSSSAPATGWYETPTAGCTTVTAPALLWLTPGVPHRYAPDPEIGWDEGFVGFTGPATTTYTELGYIEPDRPVVPLSDATGPRAVIARIVRAARRDNPLLEVETGAAVHELLVTLRRARADLAPDGDPVLKFLARDAFKAMSVADHATATA